MVLALAEGPGLVCTGVSKMTTPCKILSTHIIIGNDLFLQKLSTLLIKEKKERN
jgi:hypothetical protein